MNAAPDLRNRERRRYDDRASRRQGVSELLPVAVNPAELRCVRNPYLVFNPDRLMLDHPHRLVNRAGSDVEHISQAVNVSGDIGVNEPVAEVEGIPRSRPHLMSQPALNPRGLMPPPANRVLLLEHLRDEPSVYVALEPLHRPAPVD